MHVVRSAVSGLTSGTADRAHGVPEPAPGGAAAPPSTALHAATPLRRLTAVAATLALVASLLPGGLVQPGPAEAEEDNDNNDTISVGDDSNDNDFDFDNIQEAVDTADSGDTIEVEPGTYEESVEIGVEDLTLESAAGADGTTIRGDIFVGSEGGGASNPTSADDVVIDGFTIVEGEDGSDRGIGVTESSDVVIKNNEFEGFRTQISMDFAGDDVADITIEDNVFADVDENSGTAIGSTQGVDGLDILNNEFESNRNDIGTADSTQDVTIEKNEFTAGDSEFYVTARAEGLDADKVIDKNIFDPSAVVNPDVLDDGENDLIAVEGGDVAPVVNAEQRTGFTKIESAVDEANEGDTLEVEPGTYESVSLDVENLTVEGPNAGIHGDSDDRGDEATVDRFSLSEGSDGTTIDGFRFTGDDSDAINSNQEELEDITVANNRFVDLEGRSAVTTFSAPGDGFSYDFTVEDNLIRGLTHSESGIFLQDPDGAVIRNNVIRGGDDEAPGDNTRGIQLDNAKGTLIEGNRVQNIDTQGIQVANTDSDDTNDTEVTVADNIVENAGSEEGRGAMVFSSNEEDVVEVTGNTFRDSSRGVKFRNSANDQIVTKNQIEGNDVGVFSESDRDRSVTGNNIVDNDSAAEVQGGTLTATGNWWGDADGPDPEDDFDTDDGTIVFDQFLDEPVDDAGAAGFGAVVFEAGDDSVDGESFTQGATVDEVTLAVEDLTYTTGDDLALVFDGQSPDDERFQAGEDIAGALLEDPADLIAAVGTGNTFTDDEELFDGSLAVDDSATVGEWELRWSVVVVDVLREPVNGAPIELMIEEGPAFDPLFSETFTITIDEPEPEPDPDPGPTPAPDPDPEIDGLEGLEEPTERLSGETRIGTSVEVSQAQFPDDGETDTVVLAREDDYADALAGGPLAFGVDAPILLTETEDVPSEIIDEVDRLGADSAYLLGGEAAISSESAGELTSATGVESTTRLAGEDRFATAVEVAEELAEVGDVDTFDEVFVTEGDNDDDERGWPDAVAVSGLASAEQQTILLTEADELPEATEDALGDLGVDEATIVGGDAAVSDAIQSQIADLTGSDVERLADADRYGTSVAVAEEALEADAEAERVWLATGEDFPDAITGGPAVARDEGVLVLVDGDDPDGGEAARTWLDDTADEREQLRVLGGEAAISQAVLDVIED